MSASPLPAIQTPSPPSSTAKPATAPSSQRGSQTAFDTHLQNAQHDQSSSDDTQASSNPNVANQNGNGQTLVAQASSAPTGNAKLGDVSISNVSQADATTADSDSASGVASLAGQVLNLIDQAAGDVGSGGATGAKSTSNKQVAQDGGHPSAGQTSSPALPVTPIVPPPPVAPPASLAAKGNSDAASNANTGVGVFAANGNATSNAGPVAALSTLATQKSSATAANAGGGDAADDAGSAASATVDNNAALPSAVDNTQALAGMLSAGSHATSIVTSTTTATASQNQSTPDLAALRGVFDTTAVPLSSGTSGTSGHSLAVNSPVGSSGFAKELGQQISWLSGQEVKQAQIRLNPQDLGPLDVKVSVDHGRVDVAFMTQHPAAAAAVQQGLDQLSQMLGGQGLSLGHTTVGQHAQQQFGGQQEQQGKAQASDDADEAAGTSATPLMERVAVGLVDAFA